MMTQNQVGSQHQQSQHQQFDDQLPSDWTKLNHEYLAAAIAQVIAALPPQQPPITLLTAPTPPAAIEQLCQLFGLSPFERAIVLLCASLELQHEIAPLVASRVHEPITPTFNLALTHFPNAHWSAFTPESPLRRWHLLEIGTASSLMHSPLRISERILHFLVGDRQLDPQLMGIVKTLPTAYGPVLPPSQQKLQADMVTLLQSTSTIPLVQLCGFDSETKQAIATAACAELHYGLLKVAADRLPTDGNQLYLVQTLWEREALLTRSLLLLDCDNMSETGEGIQVASPQITSISRLLETCQAPLLVFSRDRRSVHQRPVFNFEITQPTATEQRQLWRQSLKAILETENAESSETAITTQIDKLVSHFSLSPLAIQTVCDQSLAQQAASLGPSHSSERSSEHSVAPSTLAEHLWRACLSYARPKLEELAQPIRTQVTWDDLVLPDKEKQILQTITTQVRQRDQVYEKWGFANKGQRGLGISVLFAGSSGTGKTLAAEVLANELHLDLYRIDLSSVVSKYIGETEKNLRRIFDAAEMGGAILLFDEADALFGKRSEVKDSHDRYANMEVAYLLQRMEAYRGLAILTTNLKNALDQAFLRRLRFVVQFPFPDAVQRAEIWQRVFPKLTPTENLSYQKLARLNVPGGNIRNIALNAAFLAAADDLPVQMQHVLQSAQSEYIKLERPLTEAEIKGWGD